MCYSVICKITHSLSEIKLNREKFHREELGQRLMKCHFNLTWDLSLLMNHLSSNAFLPGTWRKRKMFLATINHVLQPNS